MMRLCLVALLCTAWASVAAAHSMSVTRILVTFTSSESIEIKVDVDLTQILGSSERYYEFAVEPSATQRDDINAILPKLQDSLRLYTGERQLALKFKEFSAAHTDKPAFLEGAASNPSTFFFTAPLVGDSGAFKLAVPYGAPIDYPIALTFQIPTSRLSITRWMRAGVHESDAFDWAAKVGRSPATQSVVPDVTPVKASFDPDALPWWRQATLFLELGFRHIVPEGTDHILFVLGLFFLGITWRKLLAQTTAFTIAHATTLFLSTYGIFGLPSRYVEPAIAISIAWIAIENILKPRLGPERLAVVFCFGLVHGLGFAGSLSDILFPKRDFLIALLGFNFGVDFGQLFIIALAFLAVGWFRNKPWFRKTIAIPCSLVIAAIGIFWFVQRVEYYHYG